MHFRSCNWSTPVVKHSVKDLVGTCRHYSFGSRSQTEDSITKFPDCTVKMHKGNKLMKNKCIRNSSSNVRLDVPALGSRRA